MNLKRIIRGGAVLGLGLGFTLTGCGGVEPHVEPGETATPELGTAEQGLNVLVNGSFESAPAGVYNYQILSTGSTALPNWTIGGSIKVMNSSYKTAASGTKSVDLNGNGAGSISQMVPTVVGAGYTVRFAVANSPNCATTWRYATVTYGPSTASISNASGTWAYRSYVFNATDTSSLIKFESTSTGVACGLAIDNITVDGP
jgi:choice-of-anchor C domain-containing protein